MTKIIDQQLWIAVHLLYPNSSQALDVYYTILGNQSQKDNENYSKSIFLKLEKYFIKNSAVRSGQPFRIFENHKLDSWKILYQKSPKQHLLVIVGLMIFDFNIQELSSLLRISEQKARFFVKQSFKKVSNLKQANLKTEVVFKFKKIDDKKVSYFFMNENLVEYSLGILTSKDNVEVKQGLDLYPELAMQKQRYFEIVDEFKLLAKLDLGASEIKLNAQLPIYNQQFVKPKIIFSKNIMAATVVCVFFTFIMVLRPFSFKNFPLKIGNKSIKMQEVNGQRLNEENEIELKGSSPINLSEMPVSNTTKEIAKIVLNNNNVIKTENPIVLSPKKAVAPTVSKENSISKQGGLYRASIQVSDLDTLSDRITEKLVALGGAKAGEVELGWKKTPKVLYYHLVLPVENVDQAKDFLNKFGRLNIQFENHPRLMPVGFKRMILEVKESE